MDVRLVSSNELESWDEYVRGHRLSNVYQLAAWKKIIERTYGHKTYYLAAIGKREELAGQKKMSEGFLGILPLIYMGVLPLRGSLYSLPFLDFGGILANDAVVERALLEEAVRIGRRLGAKSVELRHAGPLSCLNETSSIASKSEPSVKTKSHKVRMLLELPESSNDLMRSFKSKLRSQIMRTRKNGLTSRVGGMEMLEDFYYVFSINMRDLGSPVHSKELIKNVLLGFSDLVKVIVVYKEKRPLACSLVLGYRDTLENPWASSLREYSSLSPNMFLYWSMLEFACDNGYRYFDFGRSSPGEGTYKFKEQWGAKAIQLYWYGIVLRGKGSEGDFSEKARFERSIEYWKKLPEPIARWIGPRIRKHIAL